MKMHADEVHTDADLVRRLIAAQFPAWSALPIEYVPASGTVNALYRLGDDMVVRLPRRAAGDLDREHATLTRLAPHLPVQIPVPLVKGAPTGEYPFEWCVDRWLEGEHPVPPDIGDPATLAGDLARLVTTLWRVDSANAPAVSRGTSLSRWDAPMRKALPGLAGEFDTQALLAAWDEVLRTPEWDQAPVWVHGDLIPGNLLVRDGRLSAVLDWGGSGLGDPACDLQPAWTLLDAASRRIFRAEVGVDDDTWTRGRGWALWTGVVGLNYYRVSNPWFSANSRYRLGQVLHEHEANP